MIRPAHRKPAEEEDRAAAVKEAPAIRRHVTSKLGAETTFDFRPAIAPEREGGQLVHSIPRMMRVGAPAFVEVRLGRAHQVTTHGLIGAETEDLPIVETMTVDLYGASDVFKILPCSRRTQLVKYSPLWGNAFNDERFGRWTWDVTPKRTGTHDLVVKVSADLSDSRGVPTSESYRDREFPVSVQINYVKATARLLKWSATGAVTALAGAYTQDAWWPKLKVWLLHIGIIG